MITFGIPCKWNSDADLVTKCVANIIDLHPYDAQVVVVDSCSNDKGYMSILRDMGAIVEDVGNVHYETGAWWHVYENFQSDYYFFLHDSLLLLQPIYDCLHNDLTTIAWSDGWHWAFDEEIIWGHDQLRKTDFEFRGNGFTSIFGSMFGCRRHMLDTLVGARFNEILPSTKENSRAMERLWGLAFTDLGYEESIKNNALYGPIHDILQVRNHRLDKTIMRRN